MLCIFNCENKLVRRTKFVNAWGEMSLTLCSYVVHSIPNSRGIPILEYYFWFSWHSNYVYIQHPLFIIAKYLVDWMISSDCNMRFIGHKLLEFRNILHYECAKAEVLGRDIIVMHLIIYLFFLLFTFFKSYLLWDFSNYLIY